MGIPGFRGRFNNIERVSGTFLGASRKPFEEEFSGPFQRHRKFQERLKGAPRGFGSVP